MKQVFTTTDKINYESIKNFKKIDFEYIVIELSSFQLFYLNNLNLHIGIILNIHQDHLDWHENFEEYIGNVFFEQTNFTEPTPTLNAASALKIVEPVILTLLPIIINLPRLYL